MAKLIVSVLVGGIAGVVTLNPIIAVVIFGVVMFLLNGKSVTNFNQSV
jgi:hypothetical protein